MKPLLKRRTVYAVTLVGMLVVISGFTFASNLFGGFTGTGGTTVNGNQQVITGGNTIYSTGLTGSMYWTSAGGTTGTCTGTSSSGTNPVVVTGWVAGGSGACTTQVDYIMQITLTTVSTLTAKTYTDQFTISSEFGGATSFTTNGVSIVCTLTTTGACSAVINIDSGVAATQAQPALDGLQVTVTGS